MTHFLGYRCSLCAAEYGPDFDGYVCPRHGDSGNLDVVLDYAAIGRSVSPSSLADSADLSLWRYLPLLPVGDPGCQGTPLRAVGGTPLYRAERLGQGLGLGDVWLKDDGRNPTASLKDRASAVVVTRARELGAQVVVTASTGNAGAALAGMAGAVAQPAVIFAPETAPPAKVAQLLIFGARVLLVRGNYDQAFDLSVAAAREFGWYCRNTGYNAFTVEGKKTAAYEICDQLARAVGAPGNRWAAPGCIFVSVGDGNIISGLHKGLKDLTALGWIDRMPRFIGVQAEGSSSLVRAWREGIAPQDMQQGPAETVADSISVGLPRDRAKAMRAVLNSGGAFVSVPDEAIMAAIPELARATGVFAEPAAVTGLAGIRQALADGHLTPDDEVVLLITGNGLKDVRGAMRSLELVGGAAHPVEPSADALGVLVHRLGLA